jgi:hypothetical protein
MTGRAASLLALLFVFAPSALPDAPKDEAIVLIERLRATWLARDAEGYLALWDFETPETEGLERAFARRFAESESLHLYVETPLSVPPEVMRFKVSAQSLSVTEPRGRVDEWGFYFEKRPKGWAIVGRETRGSIDGLSHLSLAERGYRADGLTLKFEDFELQMVRGTLFAPPDNLGPTVLVFAGEGIVKISPRPETERLLLKRFSGSPEMVEKVRAAYVRIHPADLHRVLFPTRLEPDPEAPAHLRAARDFYRDQALHSFVLDADLPGSPWWVFPNLGDALVAFDTAHHGVLTFTVFTGEAEGISLFDRFKHRQICLYSARGRADRYNEDDGRAAEVLAHDLRVRYEPGRDAIHVTDTMRLRLLNPANTLRLRLDGKLRVESITSREGGNHMFFRVRDQDSLMVSLGPFGGTFGEIALTVRYSGSVTSGPIDPEAQFVRSNAAAAEEEIPLEKVLVLTTRTLWYPQTSPDDYGLAKVRFDLPAGYVAVSGGLRTENRTAGGRTFMTYEQDQPGKYIGATLGRLAEGETSQEGQVALHGFSVTRARGEVAPTLATAADILRFFTEEFGPCPYTSLNLVLIEGEAAGGHSPPGMAILSNRPVFLRGALRDDPGNFSDIPGFFLAHELAHQWWGHGVAGENYHERWLSEGVAQYAAALWVRKRYGENVFQGVLKRLSHWALKHNDEGPISLGHRLTQISGDSQVFRAVVYDKGAYVLFMLRAIVGEEGLRRALTTLQTTRRFGKVGTEDLAQALEAATGSDVRPYLREWVYSTRVPSFTFTYHTERAGSAYRTVVQVRAEKLPGPLPLEISVTHGGGTEEGRLNVETPGGSWSVDTPTPPTRVGINTHRELLARLAAS